ncbi:sugar ABC transporter substrate-binding protein [Leifsonia sp. LS1]|uniref:ABC transporter substrate-binding protein n=1 Tax=unclassified Leifsonia TaxID=2663824 RepID=UPI001CBD9BD4|nr:MULTISPECIES: ABC transporter substrate-binding protein [unclassified Leifsonia]UAJ80735.1 ABC transporter substrate-binding protein [Leifsonia sp. ZF2019]GIT81188.1 sugar ABC transporter substrate-binding protein [Leifsonia sp. LS1]
MESRKIGRRTVLRTVALASVAAAAVALTGCSGASPSGPTTITFSYLWGGEEAKALEKVIADFNASQSEIKVVGVSSPDAQKQLTSMSSSNGSFDISDNFGNTVGSWASKGILAPLDDYLKTEKVDLGDFAPASLDQMKYEGKTYALPIAVHTQQLMYNKDLLDKAGVQPPTTMDELAAAVKKLTVTDSSGAITQIGLGNPSASTLFTTLGYAFGGTWDGTDNKTPSPDDPKNVEALDWYTKTLTDTYGADKIATFTSGLGQYMSAQDPFYTGKEAMVIDGEWQAVNIPKVAPNLNWGVVDIPAVSDDLAGSTQVTTSTLFIPSNSKHKAEAAKFLAYMVGDKPMTDFTLALGNLPSKTSLLTDTAYSTIPHFDAWLNALKSPNAKSLASQPYSAQYSTDLATAFDDVVRGVATPEKALQSVADKAKSY